MTDPDALTIACAGACMWVELDEFQREFEALEAIAPVSYDFFVELMELAASDGLGAEDYRAPIGLKLTSRLTRPWLGEFQSDGPVDHKGRCEQYRLYFGEAPEGMQSLAACLIGSKPSKTERRIWAPKQDKHIGRAMDRLLSWCKRSGTTCRMLGS